MKRKNPNQPKTQAQNNKKHEWHSQEDKNLQIKRIKVFPIKKVPKATFIFVYVRLILLFLQSLHTFQDASTNEAVTA